jgi:hypothetical protein
MMRARRRSLHLDVVVDAALAAEAELDLAAVDLHVAVAQRGQAVGLVLARILVIPDAHHGRFEQVDDGRQHLLARQAGQAEGAVDFLADLRQRLAELDHALVLHLVAHLAPFGVVAVLLAPARVAPGGLQVAVGLRADPDLGPGRRDGQRLDAFQGGFVVDRLAARVEVAKAVALRLAADAGPVVEDVAQAGRFGGGGRIAVRYRFAACCAFVEVGVALHDGPVRDTSGAKSTPLADRRTVRERTLEHLRRYHLGTR